MPGTADESGSATTGPSFTCPPAEDESQCDAFAQDCPEGFKCRLLDPWEDQTPVCTPVVDDAVGLYQSCTIDAEQCADDCAGMAGCYPIYDEYPLCVNMCGIVDCPEAEICQLSGSTDVGLCFPACDPLDPLCPQTMSTCTLRSGGFVCSPIPFEGGVGIGEDCTGGASCTDDLLCLDADDFGPSCETVFCCSELCDLREPGSSCTVPDHICQPVLTEPPPGQEHVGVCAVPGASE
ncbi:MAG: hypothetical protein AAGF11_53160 [Myxococcota bacterium]